MATDIVQTRSIIAFNTAAASENRIHDDATARRFGFTGALVPGVEVYAYMCHSPVAHWGRAFLAAGALECRFFSPVYDGAKTSIQARNDGGDLALRVESSGQRSAEGRALSRHDEMFPSIGDYPVAHVPAERPAAGYVTLPEGGSLSIAPTAIAVEDRDTYLRDIRETDEIYARDNLVHPGQILRLCNQLLLQNVVLGPWIHVGSKARNFGAAKVGDRLDVHSRVISNKETKGHAIVTLDAIVLANETTPIARVEHVAIWRPRQVVEAA